MFGSMAVTRLCIDVVDIYGADIVKAVTGWCRCTDSNRGPEVYKTPALPTELQRRPGADQ